MRSLRRREAAAAQAAEWRDPELTFRPQLSEATAAFTRPQGPDRRTGDVWGEHYNEARRRAQKQQHLRLLYERQAARDLTFAPKLSLRSRQLSAHHRSRSAPPRERRCEAAKEGGPIHDALFHDASLKRRKLIDQESEICRQIGERASSSHAGLCAEDLDRLVHSKRQHNLEIATLRSYLHRPIDPATGQDLFCPRVGRPPLRQRNRTGALTGRHMGEALFISRDEIRQPRRDMEQEGQLLAEHAFPDAGAFTHGKSELLVRQLRREKVCQIFHALAGQDSRLCGAVLGERLGELPEEIASALRPAMPALGGKTLNLADFESLVEVALKSQPFTGPRCYLLPDRNRDLRHARVFSERQQRLQEECSFAPKIDLRSERLVSAHRPSDRQPTYMQLHSLSQRYEERRQKRQAANEQMEADLCTFTPAITALARMMPSRSLHGVGDDMLEAACALNGAAHIEDALAADAHEAAGRSGAASEHRGACRDSVLDAAEDAEIEQHFTFQPRTKHLSHAASFAVSPAKQTAYSSVASSRRAVSTGLAASPSYSWACRYQPHSQQASSLNLTRQMQLSSPQASHDDQGGGRASTSPASQAGEDTISWQVASASQQARDIERARKQLCNLLNSSSDGGAVEGEWAECENSPDLPAGQDDSCREDFFGASVETSSLVHP